MCGANKLRENTYAKMLGQEVQSDAVQVDTSRHELHYVSVRLFVGYLVHRC